MGTGKGITIMGTYKECKWVHIRDYASTDKGMKILGADRGWRRVQIGGH